MRLLRGPAALALGLILVACAGPSPTRQPTPLLTALPTSGSTLQPTADPTPAPSATQAPNATPGSTAAPSPASTETPAPTATPILPRWVEKTDVGAGPSAREDHTWTVDNERGVAYLFGGRGADGASDELWAFDLVTDSWSQLTQTVDTPIPAPRFGHTATWVPNVGLVIWSGQAGSTFFDDIWSWAPDANQWIQLDSLGAVPPARYGSCASLGPDGELWISHGFTGDSGRFSDTRSYNFETGTWTDRTPTDVVPVERCLHDCYWSQVSDHLILYGGQTTGVAALGDVWAYDLATGAWTRGADSNAPPRQLYSLSTIAGTGFVFGGGGLDGEYLNDSWLIGPNLELVPLEVGSPGPTARSGATLILDGRRNRNLLFGGLGDGSHLADMWELSAAP